MSKEREDKDKPRPRRTGAAASLARLIPGGRGKHMSNDQSEIALDWLLRPNPK